MDPNKYMFEKPSLSGRLARWQMLLTEFDLQFITQKAIKGQAITDQLAGLPVPEYQPVSTDFPDEEILAINSVMPLIREWTLHFDGALNS